jgi:pilus assembly protein CpaB
MRKSSVIILVVAILMGGSAAYLTRSWLKDQKASAALQPAGTIVVAANSLAYGTVVTPDNVVEIPWFSNSLPEGAFAVKDDLLNGGRRVVLSPLKRGEAVLRSKITGPGQRASLASLLDEGKRAVTVPVDDVRGVAGFVLPGDFVDIVVIADDGSTKRQSYSDILLEHIKVLAIDQVASEGEGQPTVAKAVTVEVTKEQAQKILLATNIGKLSLILSRPLESNPDPNRRVSEKDIGRTSPEPVVRPAPPPPPAPITAAPAVPSNTVKVTIVRNGETKEYSVMRSTVTEGRRTSGATGLGHQRD